MDALTETARFGNAASHELKGTKTKLAAANPSDRNWLKSAVTDGRSCPILAAPSLGVQLSAQRRKIAALGAKRFMPSGNNSPHGVQMCWILWRMLLLLQHRHYRIELVDCFCLDLCKCLVDISGTLVIPSPTTANCCAQAATCCWNPNHLLLKLHRTRFHLFELDLVCNGSSRNRCCSISEGEAVSVRQKEPSFRPLPRLPRCALHASRVDFPHRFTLFLVAPEIFPLLGICVNALNGDGAAIDAKYPLWWWDICNNCDLSHDWLV